MKNRDRLDKGRDHPVTGSRIWFKAYIEGVPIKFTNGNMSAGVNAPSVATIQIPFSSKAHLIRPRSILTITYSLQEEENEYILFDGEILGYSISSGSSSRVVTFSASSPFSMMSKIKRYSEFGLSSLFRIGTQIFLNADSIKVAELGVPIEELLANRTTFGDLLARFNKDKAGIFPRGVIDLFKEYVENSTFRFGSDYNSLTSPYQSHNKLFDYMNQVASHAANGGFGDMVKKYLELAPAAEIISSSLGGGLLEKNDSWSAMLTFFNQFFTNFVDFGVPHKKPGVQYGNLLYMYRACVFPKFQFVCPPIDNVIMPDIIVSSNVSVNYASEPTRVALSLSNVLIPGLDRFDSRVRFAPSHQFKGIETSSGGVGGAVSSYIESVSSHDRTFGNNEDLLGVSAFSMTLPDYYVADNSNSNDAGESQGSMYTKMADSIFLEGKYASRGASVQCVFTPRVLSGLPCFIADPEFPYFGFVAGVSHSFNASGGCSTSLAISHMTTFMDYLSPTIRSSHMLGDEYSTLNIEEVYKSLGLNGSMATLVRENIPGTGMIGTGIFSVASDTILLDRIKNNLISRYESTGFFDLADNLRRVSVSDIYKASFVRKTDGFKGDEGLIKIVLAEALLDAIRSGSISDATVAYNSRDMVDVAPYNFMSESLNSNKHTRPYWLLGTVGSLNNPSSYPNLLGFDSGTERVFVSRKIAAQELSKDLEQIEHGTKTKPKLEHSVFGLFDDDTIYKLDEEKEHRS